MRGSRLSKLFRLCGALIQRPADVPRYVVHLRVPPVQSGLPWFTFGAIDFLDSWIRPHHRIFEYGCGGSTLFFATRAAYVESIEHNARWRLRVLDAVTRHGLTNVNIRHEPAGRDPPLSDSDYCRALDRPFDVIVVDGWALGKCSDVDRRAVQSRAACFHRAEEFASPGSIVVLDDSWFDDSLTHRAQKVALFSGTGPYRRGVSSTAVFFY
jgi:hypothetical protein